MADGSFRLEFLRTETKSFYREYREKSNAIIKKHTEEARALLEAQSPEDLGDFKDSWKIIPPRRQTVTSSTEYKIVNTDKYAWNKLFGRNAGLAPPKAPIFNWVQRKLPVASIAEAERATFLIRRKIALYGTERYNQLSVLGIKKDLTFDSDSILGKMESSIANDLRDLNLK